MRANRIFIALLALFFCAAYVRVEQAARQDPQPSKPAGQTSNSQSPSGSQSPGGSPEQNPGGQDRIPPQYTDVVSLTVTVTDSFNRLVMGLDGGTFAVNEKKGKRRCSFFVYA